MKGPRTWRDEKANRKKALELQRRRSIYCRMVLRNR